MVIMVMVMVIIKWLNRIIFITVYYVPFSIEKGHIATHVFSFFSLSLIFYFLFFFFPANARFFAISPEPLVAGS